MEAEIRRVAVEFTWGTGLHHTKSESTTSCPALVDVVVHFPVAKLAAFI